MPSTVNRNPNGYLMCQPDGPVIRELIERRGHSVEGFVRMMRRTPGVRSAGLVPSSRTLWRACGGREVRIEYIRTIARGLRVRPGAISDWTGDDDIWDEPEMKASA